MVLPLDRLGLPDSQGKQNRRYRRRPVRTAQRSRLTEPQQQPFERVLECAEVH